MGEKLKKLIIEFVKEIGFFILNYFRKMIYFFVVHTQKINKNSIFINHFDGNAFGDNPKYILMELLKIHDNFDIYWVCNKSESIPPLPCIHYIKPFSLQAIYRQAVSLFWISTVRMPYYSIKRQKQFYIQTWHGGLVFKKIEKECEEVLSSRYIRIAKHDSSMIDCYISDNKDNTQQIKEYFWYKKGKIYEIGSPRNDLFFANNKEELKMKMGYLNKRVAVYAPTFRVDGSFKSYNINLDYLKKCLKKRFGGEWIIILRLHPRLANISNTFIKYENDIIDGSLIEDIQELLAITDFLVTDYSSIVFDYLNTRNPAIIYASDIENYKKDRGFHIKLEEAPFIITRNNMELINEINSFNLEEYGEKIRKFKERIVFFNNGYASKKVADIISRTYNDY